MCNFALISLKVFELRFLENTVLRKMSGPGRENVEGEGKDCVMRKFTSCVLQQIVAHNCDEIKINAYSAQRIRVRSYKTLINLSLCTEKKHGLSTKIFVGA